MLFLCYKKAIMRTRDFYCPHLYRGGCRRAGGVTGGGGVTTRLNLSAGVYLWVYVCVCYFCTSHSNLLLLGEVRGRGNSRGSINSQHACTLKLKHVAGDNTWLEIVPDLDVERERAALELSLPIGMPAPSCRMCGLLQKPPEISVFNLTCGVGVHRIEKGVDLLR